MDMRDFLLALASASNLGEGLSEEALTAVPPLDAGDDRQAVALCNRIVSTGLYEILPRDLADFAFRRATTSDAKRLAGAYWRQCAGEALRKAWEARGMTQQALGDALGYNPVASQVYVSSWEAGVRPIPRKALADVARIVSIDLERLI
ncbi:MAG: helix-turn-helix domain-containing protein [Oscillospiraceae bacterium]|jgi:hypothetical protein|nr:helix-turn-helix domain-containing protein [Oscillospiraceae bacterium]